MTVTAELADGRRLEFPDGTDPAVIQRTVKRLIAPTQPLQQIEVNGPKPESMGVMETLGGEMMGALKGAARIGSTAMLPIDAATDYIKGDRGQTLSGLVTGQQPKSRNKERRETIDQFFRENADPEGLPFKAGDIVAQIAGTAGVGGAMGNTLKAISSSPKVAAVADALANYGLGKRAQGVNYATRVAAGGAAGGAAGALIDPESAWKSAAISAALPGVAPAVKVSADFIKNLSGPMREAWRTGQGRKFIDEMLISQGGDAKNKTIAAIAARGGGPSTVADDIAAANVGRTDKFGSPLVAMEAKLERLPGGLSDAAKSIAAKQESGRMATLGSVKPDLLKSEEIRSSVAGPLYDAADKTLVKIPASLQEVFGRMPKGTMELAADIARMEKRPFLIGKNIPAHDAGIGILDASGKEITKAVAGQEQKISGESLHYIKRALADIASGKSHPDISIRGDAQNAARGVLSDFLGVIEGRNGKPGLLPVYGEARKAYAGLSKPVNQSKVIQAMQDVLSGQGGPERVTPFMNVLGRGEESMLKNSTGMPRGGSLSEILSQQQMGAVKNVESELLRDLEKRSLVKNVDTKYLFDIAEEGKGSISIPNLLSRPAMLANFVMKKIGQGADDMIAQDMAKLMITDPAGFSAKYLKAVPPSQRQAVVDAFIKKFTPVA